MVLSPLSLLHVSNISIQLEVLMVCIFLDTAQSKSEPYLVATSEMVPYATFGMLMSVLLRRVIVQKFRNVHLTPVCNNVSESCLHY